MKKATFCWAYEHQQAFQKLKEIATSETVFAFASSHELFILDTDAWNLAVGVLLLQVKDGEERPIAYASRVLQPRQRNYCATRKELLALIVFTRQFTSLVEKLRWEQIIIVWFGSDLRISSTN